MSRHDSSRMTAEQAYRAMLLFLERHYEHTRSDDIAALLGSASMLRDGKPADPALRDDWAECVEAAMDSRQGTVAAE